jgi:hypothetical protein
MGAPAGNAAGYLEAARNLAPRVKEVRQEVEQQRNLPTALVEAMTQAGFFRLWLCRTLDGPEPGFHRISGRDRGIVASGWGSRLVRNGRFGLE